MDSIKDKYDYIGEFHQGVAIVVKDSFYGAILMGGHEIIAPSYDYISAFKDGYAQAIRKGECITINLSGRKCVCCENKIIEIGEAYDEVRNFYNGLACVRQKDKWGVIDEKGNELVKPQFTCISDFINNVASYKSQNHKWGFITSDGNVSKDIYDDLEIDVDGSLITTRPIRTLMSTSNTKNYECKKVRLNHQGCVIIQTDSDLVSLPSYVYLVQNVSEGIVCVQNLQGFWGAMTINGQQIIPFEYITLQDFNEGRTFGIDKNKRLHLLSLDGKSIKILDTFTDARPFIHGYASIYKNELCGLVDSFGEIVLLPDFSDINYSGIADYYILTKDDKEGIFQVSTKTVIPPLYQRIVSIEKEYIVVEIPVLGKCKIDFKGKCFVYHNDQVKYLPDWCLGGLDYEDDICYAISNTGKWGIVNIDGKTICNPIYDKLVKRENNLIYTESNNSTKDDSWKHEIYGLFDIETQVAIPAEYAEYPKKDSNFYLICKCFKKYGAIDIKGEVVVSPKYSSVKWLDGYFQIFKDGKCGLVKSDGTILQEPAYSNIEIVGPGLLKLLYLSKFGNDVHEYWTLCNDSGIVSYRRYDEIGNVSDDEYISVIYKGRKGYVDKLGKLAIKDEQGNYIPVPDRFIWAENFNNGIAKVWDCNDFYFDKESYYYVDRNYNQILLVDGNIITTEVKIDRIIYNNSERCNDYIFIYDDKYGLLSESGKVLIEAKYKGLEYLRNNLYIAYISEDGNFYRKIGIIDNRENIIFPFGDCSIKPYDGFVTQKRDGIIHEKSNQTSSYALLAGKTGYGLVDYSGKIILEPIYKNIIEFNDGYFVIEDNKWHIIDNKEFVKKETNYRSIRRLAHNFYETSMLISQTYNTYSGNYDEKKKYGILDEHGNVVLEPIYDSIGEFQEEQTDLCFTRITLNGCYGLINNNFNIIAEPIYSYISDFKEGRAFAIKNNLHLNQSGFIGANGDFQNINSISSLEDLKGHVSKVEELSNGYTIWQLDSVAENNKPLAIVNSSDDIVYSFKFHDIKLLSSGEYLVRLGADYCGRFGLLDEQFKTIVEPVFEYFEHVEEVFIVSKNISYTERAYGIIGLDGREIIPCIYGNIRKATQSLLWIETKDKELIGLADINGKILIEPCYGKVEPFISGFAKVNKGHWYDEEDEEYPNRTTRKYREGYWGIINTLGEIVLPTIYDSINIEDDGTFSVSKGIAIPCGYDNVVGGLVKGRINKNGELIIKNEKGEYVLASKKYDWQEDYNADGYSNVYYKGNWLTINNKNQIVVSTGIEGDKNQFIIPEDYEWGYNGINGFIIVEKDNKQGVINTNYNLIVNPIYDHIDILSDNSTLFVCGIIKNKSATFQSCYNWYLLNSEGETIISCHKVIQLGNSLLAVTNEDGKILIMNYEGEQTTEILLDIVYDFGISSSTPATYAWEKPKKVDGLNYAIVGLEGKYGIIDNQGKLAIYPKYSSLLIQKNDQSLANGILINAFEQKIAVKDNSVFIMPGDYDKIERLENGILLVSKNELFGCVNQIGTVIIPLKYKALTYQNNLLIAVCYDGADETYKRGVIDFQENQIVPFSQQIDEIKIESEIILYKQDWHWGAFTLQGKIICEPIYDHIVYVAHNLIKVGMDGKDYESYNDYYWEDGERYDFTNYNEYSIINWGLIDNNGNEILPLEYRAIADKVIDGVVEIRSNKRIGYVDITGRVLLEPTYKSISKFVDGYAVVSKGRDRERSVYGVINSQFKEIIPCVFDNIEYEVEIGRFKTDVGYKTIDGRYVAVVDGKELFVDKKYKYCKPFGDTCAIAVRVAGGLVNYGLIDKKSNDILPPIFSRLEHIENELYKFKINDLYGLVTSKGNIILENKYNGIGKFEDNLACVQVNVPSGDRYEQKKLYGYIDYSGNEILPPSYEFIGKRTNKFSVVMKNNLWGLFGIENHQLKIFPNVSFLGPCMENLCKMNVGGIYDINSKKTTGGLWGYISVDGEIVIEPTYEQAYGFSDGMAAVKLNGKWGFINSEGIIVVPCEYDKVEASFKDGKGKLVKDDEIYIFDKSGSQIDTYDKPRDDDDYYDGGYYDDTPSIYDNPYYNDNLDMDQQSIEFWNSL